MAEPARSIWSIRRPGPRAVALALALAATAGCATVPDHGAAVAVRNVPAGSVEGDQDVRLQPRAPAPGDSPERIVTGFLAAAKSAAGQHAIARSFLTPEAAGRWNDAGGTQVVSITGTRAVGAARQGGTQVRLAGRYLARLAADGSYELSDRPLDLRLAMRLVEGGWRIDTPPEGLLVPGQDFAEVYRPLDLYFLSPDGGTVVPDRRYADVDLAALPSHMIKLLLQGPSAWLRPGVSTAAPPGVTLHANVVQSADMLVVDLGGEVQELSGAQRAGLAAQIVWTLVTRFPVRGVRLLADGQRLDVPGAGARTLTRRDFSSYAPDVLTRPVPGYYLHAGALRSSGAAIAGPAGKAGAGLRSAAVSNDLSRLAAVRRAGSGQVLIVGDPAGPLLPRYAAHTLAAPTWGSGTDDVLVVADGQKLVRVPRRGAPVTVRAPDLGAYGPVAVLRLSRDGSRLALVAGRAGARHLLVGVLARSSNGWRVANLRAIAPGLGGVGDLAWAGAFQLLVLGRMGGAPVQPYKVDVDGATLVPVSVEGLPAQREHVAAAPGQPDLAEAGGQLWRRYGARWTSPIPAPGGAMPFYPD